MARSGRRRESEATGTEAAGLGTTRAGGAETDEDGGMTGDPGVVRGAGGVVFNGAGEVLLLRHANGSWVFPKGHIEPGESPLETAVREIEEEAGVTARCNDAAETFTTTYRNPRGELRRITWFRMQTDAEAPVLREKLFPDGAFVAPQEALKRLSFQEDRNLLARLLGADGGGA
ncbi:MAG: NUDIX domain-containing protein [Deinococcales bacterium]|jgi:diadenosine hexaphosphate hydrolase (ATP-forming)